MKKLLIVFLLLTGKLSFGQTDCFFIKNEDKLAYFINDSSQLFSGHCKKYDTKGSYNCFFVDGKAVYETIQNKNGIITDSIYYTDYLESSYKLFSWWENGILQTSQNFVNDTIHGICTFYYKNGNIKSELFFNMGALKKEVLYFQSGQKKREVNYSNEKIVNPVYEWDGKGNKFEVTEKLGKKRKIFGLEFWSTNEIDRKKITLEEENQHHTEQIQADENIDKELEKVICSNDLIFQTCITYRNDVMHGIWEKRFINGPIKERRFYENGKSAGKWTIWDRKGYILEESVFGEDTITSIVYTYNFRKNRLKKTIKYVDKANPIKVIKKEVIIEEISK